MLYRDQVVLMDCRGIGTDGGGRIMLIKYALCRG